MNPVVRFLHWLGQRIGRFEYMDGDGACPIYLLRWTLFYRWGLGIYLHNFTGDDWAIDPHDHPRRFVSIGLQGWYFEDVYNVAGELIETSRYEAPWCRSFPAEYIHRVRAIEAAGRTWTLVIVLPKSRDWGFVKQGRWIQWRDYVWGGHARKSC